MKRSSRSLCYAALLTTVATALFASQPTADAQGAESQEQSMYSTTFTFPGGTLKEYFELVKKTFGVSFHVNLAPEVADLRIESVELKGAETETALALLHHLAHGRFEIDAFGRGVRGKYIVKDAIWRISPPPRYTRVFSVRDLISNKSGEPEEDAMRALISAIDATLAIGSHTSPDVKIKMHPDTGLLLVSGTQEQVKIIEQVVSNIDGAQRRASEKTIQDLNAQIETLLREQRNLRIELGQRRQSGESPQGEHTEAVPNVLLPTAPATSRPEANTSGRGN